MPRNTGICTFLAAPGLFPCRPSCALPWLLLRVHWRTYACPIPSRFGFDPTLRRPLPSGLWSYGFLQPSRNLIGPYDCSRDCQCVPGLQPIPCCSWLSPCSLNPPFCAPFQGNTLMFEPALAKVSDVLFPCRKAFSNSKDSREVGALHSL